MSTSLGFRTPSPNSIQLVDYEVSIGGEPLHQDATDQMIVWNDSLGIRAKFYLDVDLEQSLRDIGFRLSDNPRLAGGVSWKSTGSGLHGATSPQTIQQGSNEFFLELPGSSLGSNLIFKPFVVLENAIPNPSSSVIPTLAGSRLWETVVQLRLEGDGSQFPTSVVDFKSAGMDPVDALWRIRIEPRLDSHFSGAVRLYLNSGHPRTAEYLRNPSAPEQLDFSLFLKADVVLQLLTFAMSCDLDDLQIAAEERGTLAEALLEVHSTYFPSNPLDEVRAILLDDPGLVSARISGAIFSESSKGR